MTTRPTVEPAGVSEQLIADLREMAGTCAIKGPLLIQVLDSLTRARQQLAERRGQCDDKQREIDRLCAMAAQVEDLRRFREQHPLAPTSQPSRGKPDELCDHCGEHANEHGAMDHPYIPPRQQKCTKPLPDPCDEREPVNRCTCPDCAQPERQDMHADGFGGITAGNARIPKEFAPSPPQDDIVAGLREIIDEGEGRSVSHADVDVIRRAIAALGEKGWQPMATVPKDGTIVDLWHKVGTRMVEVWWAEDCWSNCSDDSDYTHWMLPPAPPVSGGK